MTVQPLRSLMRRRLDQRVVGLEDRIGARPAGGWVRAIRDALGMSTFELAGRMGVTHARVSQIERAEGTGSVRLSTLGRVAEALNCRLLYVLVPDEPLEQMVYRQALGKAAEEVAARAPQVGPADGALLEEILAEQVQARALELVDRRGLWRATTPTAAEPSATPSDRTDATRRIEQRQPEERHSRREESGGRGRCHPDVR